MLIDKRYQIWIALGRLWYLIRLCVYIYIWQLNYSGLNPSPNNTEIFSIIFIVDLCITYRTYVHIMNYDL